MRAYAFARTPFVLLAALVCVVSSSCSGDETGPPAPDPAISVSVPSAVQVNAGGSGTVTVTIGRNGGYAGPVTLRLEGAPTGVTGTFSPATVPNGSTTSTLTLNVAATVTAPASHNLTVQGTGQGVHAAADTLAISVAVQPEIDLALDAMSLSVNQGGSGTVGITIERTNFTGAVALSVSGAPSGVTATVTPTSVTTSTAALNVAVGGSVAAGTYPLTLTAQAPGIETRTAPFALTVRAAPAIQLSPNPTSLIIARGAAGTVAITIGRTNYSGSVELSVSGVPTGVTATIAPTSTTGNDAVLTVSVGDGAPLGGGPTLVVTGEGQGIAQAVSVPLTVEERPAIAFELSPTSLTLAQGATGTAAVAITRTNYTGNVTLTASGAPAGMTASIAPSPTTGNDAMVTVQVGSAVTASSHPLTVTAAGSGIETRTATLTVQVTAAPPAVRWAQVSVGPNHSCGVTADGTAYCWGYNADGRLGTGDIANKTRPALVAGGHTWASVSAGGGFSCGITTSGAAYCWGAGIYGQLGNGSTSYSETTPVPVSVSGGDTWAMISAGIYHACGVTPDGRGYCWGGNAYGQLGNGNTTQQTTRVLVSGGRTWRTISAGGTALGDQVIASHTCGVTTAGEALCWGRNYYGQLGDGTSGDGANSSPVAVAGGRTWADVSTGNIHTCGVTTAGDAYCWGYNDAGQLGNGNTTEQPAPTLVLNDHKWTRVSAGWHTTCGLTTTGAAYCWGSNGWGQAGNGNTSGAQTAPVLVAGGYTWTVVAPGYAHACGRTNGEVAYCWGLGSDGELGTGSTTQSLVPLRISDPQ